MILSFWQKFFRSFLFLLFLWCAGFSWFLYLVPRAVSSEPVARADAIVVLTGGAGRLEYGLLLLSEDRGKILFISGAGKKTSVSDIISAAPADIRGKIDAGRIVLDLVAENTIGNASETAKWLKKKKAEHILLVTSDYHIPRALLEFSEKMPQLKITSAPVFSSSGYLNNAEILLSEYHKYMAAEARHILLVFL